MVNKEQIIRSVHSYLKTRQGIQQIRANLEDPGLVERPRPAKLNDIEAIVYPDLTASTADGMRIYTLAGFEERDVAEEQALWQHLSAYAAAEQAQLCIVVPADQREAVETRLSDCSIEAKVLQMQAA